MPALVWIVVGALVPLWLDSVPAVLLPACFALGVLVLFLPRPSKVSALPLLACAWALANVQLGLETRYTGATDMVRLEGRIGGLPRVRDDLLEFRLRTDSPVTGLAAGSVVLVRWYRPARSVHAGERWAFDVRLRPPRGRVNFTGPDVERNLFAAGISALAVVSNDGGHRLQTHGRWAGLPAWRERIRARLRLLLAERRGAALVLALAVADRDSLDPHFRDAVRATGTGHLLAISGLHVGMVALFGFGLGRITAGPLMARFGLSAIYPAALMSGLLVAAAYAGLAGFSVPTRRALIMLCAPLACVLLRRNTSPWRVWLLALAVVVLVEPLAPLQAGFWLSFSAVAILLFLFGPRTRPRGAVSAMLMAQVGITLFMLPVGMTVFQQAVAGGLLANLVAIPWVGFITLPLTLAGTALAAMDAHFAEPLLQMAAQSSVWLTKFLTTAAAVLEPLRWPTATLGAGWLLCALLGGGLLMMPWDVSVKLCALAMYLAALCQPKRPPEFGGAVLEMLDVGQGLAVLVGTREHLLLYDTGPGFPGRWDLAGAVLTPALARLGRQRPDRLIVSHGDLDHAGALARLRREYGDQRIIASLPPGSAGPTACREGIAWSWDGVSFSILHPSGYLPYLGNDSSCVLAVRTGGVSILLPGDIGTLVERRLSLTDVGIFEILVAAHHGSRSSSSPELLAWARPSVVLISAGAGNRFGFPHPEVLERIHQTGAAPWSTEECGSVRIAISAEGAFEARSARRDRKGFWRWPAARKCP